MKYPQIAPTNSPTPIPSVNRKVAFFFDTKYPTTLVPMISNPQVSMALGSFPPDAQPHFNHLPQNGQTTTRTAHSKALTISIQTPSCFSMASTRAGLEPVDGKSLSSLLCWSKPL